MTIESTIDFTDSHIHVEDITDRVDELRGERDDYEYDNDDGYPTSINGPEVWAKENPEDAAELVMLENILDELRGNGGDHQWDGGWYPQELIAESAFVEYITDLIHDCYEIKESSEWPYRHMTLDYEAAAKEAEQDYTTIEIDGNEFFYR